MSENKRAEIIKERKKYIFSPPEINNVPADYNYPSFTIEKIEQKNKLKNKLGLAVLILLMVVVIIIHELFLGGYKAVNKSEKQNIEILYTSDTEIPDRTNAKKIYCIVAGSFNNWDNAAKLQDDLRKKGYKSYIMSDKNAFFRVIIKAYEDEETAKQQLKKLNNSDMKFWILAY